MTIDKLYKIIQDRRLNKPKNSYISFLFKAGRDRIIQKVGEEATEVIIAAKNNGEKQIISEVADLWFHVLILLAFYDIQPKDILVELEQRAKK